jgi:hypothetical protein
LEDVFRRYDEIAMASGGVIGKPGSPSFSKLSLDVCSVHWVSRRFFSLFVRTCPKDRYLGEVWQCQEARSGRSGINWSRRRCNPSRTMTRFFRVGCYLEHFNDERTSKKPVGRLVDYPPSSWMTRFAGAIFRCPAPLTPLKLRCHIEGEAAPHLRLP